MSRFQKFKNSSPRFFSTVLTTSSYPPLQNLKWLILTLHLNYITGYTDSILVFSEWIRVVNDAVDSQGQCLAAPGPLQAHLA